MIDFKTAATIVLIAGTAACAGSEPSAGYGMRTTGVISPADLAYRAPPMDATRKIAEQDCSKPVEFERGNLRCK